MEDRISSLQSNLDEINIKLHQLAWKIDDVDKKILEEPSIDTQAEVYDLRGKLLSVENELFSLRVRIGELEGMFSSYQNSVQTLPDTNIISHSLWKRMWAVFGHGLLGNITLVTWIIAIVFLLVEGI